jgi:hypothetical protein
MAEERAQAGKEAEDEVLGSADVKRLVGYLRSGPKPGFISLFNSTELDDALEIPDGDIVKRIELVSENGDLPKTAVWVRRQTKLLRTHRISISREAEFLQGALLAEFTGRIESGSHAPVGGLGQISVQLYIAKTETTLTCWQDCTKYISGCLTSG